ncbi:MAG: T9SS type A sorting domain-containing protein [Chitinophagales bacterium]
MKQLFTALLCTLVLCSFSQGSKFRVINLPVERNTIDFRTPWMGGMNSPQFSEIDLNQDNLMDLFVFDRVGDKVLTYLKTAGAGDTSYLYAPQYESLFPADLNSWAVIRDYNYDNIPDIFTHENTGTRVFKGSLVNNQLHFELVAPLLLYNDGQYNVNIWTNVDDIPDFVDVNRDGDLDVLTYGIFGASVEYYENQTMEHQGDPHYAYDSLKYIENTMCWGLFAQNSISNSIVLNVSCKGGSGGGGQQAPPDGQRHAGNTIYSFDADNDGDVDLLNGNIGYDNLAFVHNCGDSSFAQACSWDSLFPSCGTSILMPTYPGGYGADLNGDNLEDLLIAPNARNGGRDVKNVMVYYNTEQACQFQYVNDSFLVRHFMDFGTDSKPYFFDFNGDNLQDMVIGNYGYFRPFNTYMSTLAFYQNTGTTTSPHFEMVTENYNHFDSLNLIAIHPAFGDLDGDGFKDMVVGESLGYLYYFRNTGGQIAKFGPNPTTPQYFGLDIGNYSAPCIYDVNGDSINDLVVGRKDGKLTYFRNFGTTTNPQFSQDSSISYFGGINITVPGYTEGYSAPFIQKEGSELMLYVGSNRGAVFKYRINTDTLTGTFVLLDSNVVRQDAGTKATISIADINSDGKAEYLLGNSRGGLILYSDSLWDSSTIPLVLVEAISIPNNSLRVYPNPTSDFFTCVLNEGNFVQPLIEIYNVLGERVYMEMGTAKNSIRVNTADFSSGLYFIRITDGNRVYPGKIIVQ